MHGGGLQQLRGHHRHKIPDLLTAVEHGASRITVGAWILGQLPEFVS